MRASRELTDRWEQQVRRVVSRQDRVVADARVTESLAATVGAPTLVALASALDGAEDWVRDGDTYRHDVDGGYVLVDTDSWELQLVASAEGDVAVAADVSATARSELTETVEAEAEASYYSDGWGGHTSERAHSIASENADRAIRAEFDARVARARADATAEGAARAEAEAAREAERRLADVSAQRREELRRDAERRLTAVGVQGRNVFNRVLATAYRDGILAYARARGADGISCAEENGVLDIEFDIQV